MARHEEDHEPGVSGSVFHADGPRLAVPVDLRGDHRVCARHIVASDARAGADGRVYGTQPRRVRRPERHYDELEEASGAGEGDDR